MSISLGNMALKSIRAGLLRTLGVSVVSSSTCFALLRELGISDASMLVERKVIVGEEEMYGSIVKCLGGCTDTGCLDNLYKSAKDLSCKDCMISGGCKAMLLDPKLPPYFGTKNQLLQIEEQVPCKPKFVCCATCCGSSGFITSPRMCCHSSRRDVQLSTMNPKFPGAVTELGGAFVAGQAMFMVTVELAVKPLSTMSGISLLSKFNIPISDIEEQIVCIGEKEAMSLLKASLVSNSVLSDVFYPKMQKQMGTKSKWRIFFSAGYSLKLRPDH
ncbi:hypothetical protein CKAN_01264300 [Cinnamomum micranthum f. kanehirae]|uniref:DUF674 domain-containing protein n=1 Tax=Cinnamomum micranthum f. kanehirae TaxID=337451 RepID=A0A443NZ96_9MAGN|nr:hypothetical protein CKAN_01264300 [Cinnamomum micranthum f. kanehirae]